VSQPLAASANASAAVAVKFDPGLDRLPRADVVDEAAAMAGEPRVAVAAAGRARPALVEVSRAVEHPEARAGRRLAREQVRDLGLVGRVTELVDAHLGGARGLGPDREESAEGQSG
jgi:hypothetical protein